MSVVLRPAVRAWVTLKREEIAQNSQAGFAALFRMELRPEDVADAQRRRDAAAVVVAVGQPIASSLGFGRERVHEVAGGARRDAFEDACRPSPVPLFGLTSAFQPMCGILCGLPSPLVPGMARTRPGHQAEALRARRIPRRSASASACRRRCRAPARRWRHSRGSARSARGVRSSFMQSPNAPTPGTTTRSAAGDARRVAVERDVGAASLEARGRR